MKKDCALLAEYHAWAYQKLFNSLQPVSDADYHEDQGLYFKSIHGTLNHLLLADKIWYGRFTREPFKVTGLDQELETDRTRLCAQILDQANAWIRFIEASDEALFSTILRYTTTQGKPSSTSFEETFLHVFNHGTHHRGQISAVITRLKHPVPEMDLMDYIRQRSSMTR